MKWAAAGSQEIHGSALILMDFCWGGGPRALPESQENISPSIFMLLEWGRRRSQNHRKYHVFNAFSLFVWLGGGAGGQRIIENIWIPYMFIVCLVAPESLKIYMYVPTLWWFVWWCGTCGQPQIIKNTLMSVQCDGSFGWVRGVGERRITKITCLYMDGHALFGGVKGACGPIIPKKTKTNKNKTNN